MEQRQKLTLTDGLYNAGLLGMLKVLRRMERMRSPDTEPVFTIDGTTLEVSLSAIGTHFTQCYFDALLDTYESQCKCTKLLQSIAEVTAPVARQQEHFQKKLGECVIDVCKTLERASYKAAYVILEQAGENYDFQGMGKRLKKNKDTEQQLALLSEIEVQLRKNKRTFLLKDIAYARVQNYWSGIAFLHKSKNTMSFEKSFEDEFIAKIVGWKPARGKKKLTCFQCGAQLPSGGQSMSWINDMGTDIKRKTNGFWNFHVDLTPCPLCNLVYACLPLGFSGVGGEGIFLNQTDSIAALEQANQFGGNLDEAQQGDSFYTVLNRYLFQSNQIESKNLLENLQVIRRIGQGTTGTYRVNILQREQLKRLTDCKKELERLSHTPLHQSVMTELLSGRNLFAMLIQQEERQLKGGYTLGTLKQILQIQNKMFTKGEKSMKYRSQKINEAVRAGRALRKHIRDSVNANKLATLSYGLLSALRTGDWERYVEAVARQCLSLGRDIPVVLIDALGSDDDFAYVGHAFLIGLNSDNAADKATEAKEETV